MEDKLNGDSANIGGANKGVISAVPIIKADRYLKESDIDKYLIKPIKKNSEANFSAYADPYTKKPNSFINLDRSNSESNIDLRK